ncbi:type II toxin-antitoxin system RelE/ParE family toxin [Streptomyces chartreusis]|uniref:type II toxin-antitoxin system RelE family toxin n=1 Tax=Streptomyces chartreusis TaxID=1969 RepID=UPI0037167E6A
MATLSRRAQKDLEQLPNALRIKALNIIDRLDSEPGLGKKLLGPLAGIRSARLGRSHRILYEVKETGTAHVLTVSQRRDAYR